MPLDTAGILKRAVADAFVATRDVRSDKCPNYAVQCSRYSATGVEDK